MMTFSNFSLTGLGLSVVTASTISFPIRNAASLLAPFNITKRLQKQDLAGKASTFIELNTASLQIYTQQVHYYIVSLSLNMPSAHLSVSPYTTLPPQRGVLLTSCIALFSVSRALLMMLSMIYSTMMMEEQVYKYIVSPLHKAFSQRSWQQCSQMSH